MGLNFVGQYVHQMDEKGRVSLPSAYRREADGDRFVLVRWEQQCLTLFPIAKWEEVQERLIQFRKGDSAAWDQVRLLVSDAVEVSPDKQGRILVPAALQEAVGLSGAVLLSGNIDRVDLWNPDTFSGVAAARAGGLPEVARGIFS